MKEGILKIKAGLFKSERPKQSEHGADYKMFLKNEIRMSAITFTYIIFLALIAAEKKTFYLSTTSLIQKCIQPVLVLPADSYSKAACTVSLLNIKGL